MAKEDFKDLLWFLAVAEEKSFTRAAAKLGITQSTLSHTIKRLETRMGIRLLTRTTRSVATTEAGERLRQSLSPRIAEIETEIAALMEFRDKPAGTIRLTVSDHAFEIVVWPKLRPVLAAYPDIKLELSIDNGLRNIVEDGFDAGVRLGESVEKDMIAVRIGPDWRMVAVASPDYFAAHPAPQHPQELIAHNCMNMRQTRSGGLYAWEFEKDGQELRVRVDGQLTFNASYAMVDAALNGYGIAFLPEDLVKRHIASGKLVQVLDDWCLKFPGYYIYYPSRRQNLPAFKVIVDALRQGEV
ncbi:MAG: LysR family transcriptional regulator [Mesorhizobium sp.]|uniref:LysR family transcriptional regulator n=1 Tax=unclassified Mesorhizobium TaxID=325217 RepID=UPI000FD2942F|nr:MULTISPECIES: LysR family transcriptional regulator [unclassified Mesorhizobium]RUV30779.1 LysR family transcriptional regulator [Mesorhizobium sp. M5C.F.Ca.IN.020.32.2.1]RWC44992.1 MAG: LysR family transcriptional regulator [Mesorhizobium sp.]RWD45335.1 MAG: LysR family transcriptional regulator [Mesorhizobium sp.]RWE14202.1 MAG: LysR family transcriptional regulator [Mesorhizobium sp.]RWE61485.1 MAG: LysR family transcriptional regulator [Mesorhizobium sp.]